jgi:hypothetical protein
MSKTKEQILTRFDSSISYYYTRIVTPLEYAHEAMDAFAEQQSIAFAEWMDTTAVRNGPHEWTVGDGNETERYTTAGLYKAFMEIFNPPITIPK